MYSVYTADGKLLAAARTLAGAKQMGTLKTRFKPLIIKDSDGKIVLEKTVRALECCWEEPRKVWYERAE